MSLDSVKERIARKLALAANLNAKVKFDFGDEGRIFVDATQNPPAVSEDDADADTTLACTLETFEAILDGNQDPNIAFMLGRLKVRGSMGLALKLNGFLEA